MKYLRGLLMIMAGLTGEAMAAAAQEDAMPLLTDFGPAAPVTWYTVNDGVMGGRSQGGFRVEAGVLVFTGSTNTNGGGFSSIRTRERPFDLTGHDGIRLRVKADGRRYTFRLTTSVSRRGRYAPSYWADFETRKGVGWETIDVPFERFRPRWRGRMLSGPTLDLGKIDSLGLMIYDKLDGPFRLEADWIRAYRTPQPFSMTQFQGKQRPLLVFAPKQDDPRLVQQLDAVKATLAQFRDRAMALIVVLADGTSHADGTVLTAAQAQALRSQYAPKDAFAVRLVGKDGGVKHESKDIADMASIYALIDDMPMRRRESR